MPDEFLGDKVGTGHSARDYGAERAAMEELDEMEQEGVEVEVAMNAARTLREMAEAGYLLYTESQVKALLINSADVIDKLLCWHPDA